MQNVIFVMHVYDESVESVKHTVEQVRRFYPSSRITLIYDGVIPYSIFNVVEIYGERLKIDGKNGLFTKRYLDYFLTVQDASYCIKIDPDTEIVRRIEIPLPDSHKEVVFCRVDPNGIPHGGAIGFTKTMAKKLSNSGWLEEPHVGFTKVVQQDPILKKIIQFHGIVCIHRSDFGYTEFPRSSDVFRHRMNTSRISLL